MKRARESHGEVRARFGSAPVTIAPTRGRYSAMISAFRSVWSQGLLIRRSWDRSPPGSYSENVALLPRSGPLAPGSYTGNSPLNGIPDLYADSKIFTAWRFGA